LIILETNKNVYLYFYLVFMTHPDNEKYHPIIYMRSTTRRRSTGRGHKLRRYSRTGRRTHHRRRSSTTLHRYHRRRTHKYRGGYGPGATPYGSPYTAGNSSSWPGVAGNAGQSNYIARSPNGVPSGYPISADSNAPGLLRPAQTGGSSILTDITNVAREAASAVSHFGSTLRGVIPSMSSYPSVVTQPIGLQSNALLNTRMPPNIPKIHQDAGRYVAGI